MSTGALIDAPDARSVLEVEHMLWVDLKTEVTEQFKALRCFASGEFVWV
jgi:hypothetical protein